jgi:hypothetical protein
LLYVDTIKDNCQKHAFFGIATYRVLCSADAENFDKNRKLSNVLANISLMLKEEVIGEKRKKKKKEEEYECKL